MYMLGLTENRDPPKNGAHLTPNPTRLDIGSKC